jgi:hypothetical protein
MHQPGPLAVSNIKTMKPKSTPIHFLRLVAVSILLSNCDPGDNRLEITNNSNRNIYVYYSCDSTLNDLSIFRNGYYHDYPGDSLYMTSNYYIKTHTSKNIDKRGLNAWVSYINKCENKQLHLFIFSDTVVSKFSDSVIRNNKMYEKHIVLAKSELNQRHWKVIYP